MSQAEIAHRKLCILVITTLTRIAPDDQVFDALETAALYAWATRLTAQ